MKRMVLVGVACFLLGSMGSPKAANDGEVLALLCKRFRSEAGPQLQMAKNVADVNKGNDKGAGWAAYAEVRALSALERVVCAK